ncbi:hypothetical protein [Priestia aryabhattai]
MKGKQQQEIDLNKVYDYAEFPDKFACPLFLFSWTTSNVSSIS